MTGRGDPACYQSSVLTLRGGGELIKTTWLTSELEEQPTAAAATHCSGREMLPTEHLGVLGRFRAVGCTRLAETRAGMPHGMSHPSKCSCLAGFMLSLLPTKAAKGWRTLSSMQGGELQAGDGAKAGTGWVEYQGH